MTGPLADPRLECSEWLRSELIAVYADQREEACAHERVRPENLLDPTDLDQWGVAYQLQRWLWTRRRGYHPLRERRERAWAYLRERRAARPS